MLDKSKAMNDFQITERQYDALLSDFVVQAAEKINILESTAYSKGSADVVHSLKGVAGNLRLDDCYNSARRIEIALKENDRATVDRELAILKNAVAAIRSVIKYS